MATIEDALNTYLLNQSNITNMVGSDIYFAERPSGLETDYICYEIIMASNDSMSFGDVTTANPTLQLDVFSKSASRAITLGGYILTALHGFDGTLATGLQVTLSTARGPRVFRDQSDEQWFHGIVECEIEYTRS